MTEYAIWLTYVFVPFNKTLLKSYCWVHFVFIKTCQKILITRVINFLCRAFPLPISDLHKISPLRTRPMMWQPGFLVRLKANSCHSRPNESTVVLHIVHEAEVTPQACTSIMVRVTSVSWKSLDRHRQNSQRSLHRWSQIQDSNKGKKESVRHTADC